MPEDLLLSDNTRSLEDLPLSDDTRSFIQDLNAKRVEIVCEALQIKTESIDLSVGVFIDTIIGSSSQRAVDLLIDWHIDEPEAIVERLVRDIEAARVELVAYTCQYTADLTNLRIDSFGLPECTASLVANNLLVTVESVNNESSPQ